jgi:hypothetical protein
MITSNTFKILSIVQTDNSLTDFPITAPRLVARAFQSPLESSKSFNYYPVALQLTKKERLLFKKKIRNFTTQIYYNIQFSNIISLFDSKISIDINTISTKSMDKIMFNITFHGKINILQQSIS